MVRSIRIPEADTGGNVGVEVEDTGVTVEVNVGEEISGTVKVDVEIEEDMGDTEEVETEDDMHGTEEV